jgi:hypothetical protein
MVKYRPRPKGHETGSIITTKSPYGSHADMVVEPEEVEPSDELYLAHLHHSEVVCKDDKGYYITERSRLDNGLADPNRYSLRRE